MVLGNSVDAQVTGFQSLNAATGVWNGRTLVAGTGISITNPTGTAGDPTISSSLVPTTNPAFSVSGTPAGAITGDGTIAILSFPTTNFDTTASFAGSTYTAPVTGIYFFNAAIVLGGLTAAHTGARGVFNKNGGPFSVLYTQNPFAAQALVGPGTPINIFGSGVLVDMVAGDTMTVSIQVSGGALVVSGQSSFFQGFLVQAAAGVSGVTGPGVSTDRAIVTWNGVTGQFQFDNPTTRITAAGESTNTGQPAFVSFLSATDNNVTGAGATYLLGSGSALTITQQGSGLTAAGVYTAPVTGYYHFTASISVGGLTALMTSADATFLRNGVTVIFGESLNPGAVQNFSTGYIFNVDKTLFLTAGNTIQVQLIVLNGVGNTVDVGGGSISGSTFTGVLLT